MLNNDVVPTSVIWSSRVLKCGIENSLRDVGLENDLHGTMNNCRDEHASSRAMLSCCSSDDGCGPELCDLWFRGGWLPIWNGWLMVGWRAQVNQWQ